MRRVRHGHVVARLGPRIIALSTMSPPLKVALGASYAVLFALAIMTAAHGLLETADTFRFAVGLYIPLGVYMATVPIMVLIASLVMSGAVLANRAARWGSIALLAFLLWAFSLYSYPAPWTELDPAKAAALSTARNYALLQLEVPAVFLFGIAILHRRLPRWSVTLGCLVAFSALAAIMWRLNSVADAGFAGWVASSFLILSMVYLVPALLVVGADIAEWAEILGESTAEALPPVPGWRSWIFVGVAIAANIGILAYWLSHFGAFNSPPSHGAIPRELLSFDQVALAGVIFAAGMTAIFAVLMHFPARSSHAGHFGYVTILAFGYLIISAPMIVAQYAEEDAPPPTRIFRLSHAAFSIEPASGWESTVVANDPLGLAVDFYPAEGQFEFLTIMMTLLDEHKQTLNEVIATGETFPPTDLVFPAPDEDGWMHFEATLTRYGHVARGWVGIRAQSVTPEIARGLGLAKVEGVQVMGATADGPAARAGIRATDIIIAINGEPVKNAADFSTRLGTMTSGSVAEFALLRNGEQRKVSVTLGELPQGLKPQFHFDVWKKTVAFERGRTDLRFDSHYTIVGSCRLKDDDCMTAVESMRKSWSPGARLVPSPWGQLAVRWFWLAVAAIACCLIPWRRQRSDARALVALSILALGLFAFSYSGINGNDDELSSIKFDIARNRWSLQIAMVLAVVSGIALIGWLAVTKKVAERDSHLLRMVTALNFSLLLLYGAFEGLAYSAHSAEENNIAKGLLVIAALTWEITASGSVTNIATRHLPRSSRLLLFLAYILLVAVTVFMFFPSRYRNLYLKAFDAEEFILIGIIVLGVPLIFAAFATRIAGLLQSHITPGHPPASSGAASVESVHFQS
jgi:PDZ domain